MFLAVLVFTITAGFLFYKTTDKAYAANYTDCSQISSSDTGVCYSDTGRWENVSCQDCTTNKCTHDPGVTGGQSQKCQWVNGLTNNILPVPVKNLTIVEKPIPETCSYQQWASHPINCSLSAVLSFSGTLLEGSATLFAWVINVDNLRTVIAGPSTYQSWQLVRDFLNIAFILVLLYSAFCTILQIEKYSYKKILLTLVIMALLVNFSFPITRFIIDVSNVLMYTLIKDLLGSNAGNTFATISSSTGITEILKPAPENASGVYLISAIVFVFILAITLLAIALMLVIRMVALALLIIFSPLAFVATILPDAGGYSSKWWDNLFRYSFFGPIMIFVIYIATQMIKSNATVFRSMYDRASEQSVQPNIVGSIALFAIPIILLWMGMGVAQSMSIAGAATVMGGAQKFAKWAGKAPFRAAWWGTKKAASATGVPGGLKQKWDSWKDKLNASQKSKEAQIAAHLGVTGATVKDAETRAAEHEKNHESDASLIIKAEAGDAGAALALVKRGKMDDKIYGNFVTNNKDASLKEHVAKKLKKNRVDILIANKLGDTKEVQKAKEAISKKTGRSIGTITDDMAKMHIEREEYGNLSPEDIKSQYWNVIIGKASKTSQNYMKRMFAGLTDEAKEDIGKSMSKNNRTSIDKLRKGGIFI